MDNILTICLHQLLGIAYSISEIGVPIVLTTAWVLLSIGILRASVFLVKSLHSTSRLRKELSNVTTEIQASDLSSDPEPDCLVNIVPDDLNPAAFTLGWTKPEIFLTTALVRDLDLDALAIVIHHEMGHVIRRDPLSYMALDTLAELLWFIPILRHQVERARLRAELACDSIAVSKGYSETDVARTLARVAGTPVTPVLDPKPVFSSILDHLEIRIRSLLGENPLTLARIPLKAVLASNLIVFMFFLSFSTAIASQVDPGGYVSLIRTTSVACTEGHPEVDLIEVLGLECPHCGSAALSNDTPIPPPACHTN